MKKNITYNSIGKKAALKLFKSGWWKGMDPHKIVNFQFFTNELCMPFGDFQEAVQKVLGRPVWTHEFADRDGLARQILGEKKAPTMQEILDMIPAEKRIVVVAPES